MQFMWDGDDLDALVLFDRATIEELTEEHLYSFDILLDPNGKTELIYDFPEEDWKEVYERETGPVKQFCNDGKMVIWLMGNQAIKCSFQPENDNLKTNSFIYSRTGDLVVAKASEIIQASLYPNLEMEILANYKGACGWYAVSESFANLRFHMQDPNGIDINNLHMF